MLNNLNKVTIEETITLDVEIYQDIVTEEAMVLDEFVFRMNNLIEADALDVTKDLQLSKTKAPVRESVIQPRVAVFNLLSVCESHAAELKNVYDNALFSTKHIVAGAYFAERVRENGIWDYKTFLGVNTSYYAPDLGATMKGETIGNFHYGYVGSVCFGETTLKTSAGFVQILSGTSELKYYKSYFDDPKDQNNIQWGIDTYHLYN